MFVLFETAAGYATFKVLDEAKLQNADNIWTEFFATPEKTKQMIHLVSFDKFKSVTEAFENAQSLSEGTMAKSLKKALKGKKDDFDQLAVGDSKLGLLIKEKLGLPCVYSPAIVELMRGIRSHIDVLLAEHKHELSSMTLALAHSLGRYKVKFNPDKIDTMIVQAVSLLDDLDKELNNYIMRCREWYGWHFPELSKIIQDHLAYVKVVKTMGMRSDAQKVDLSAILPEELEARVKDEAEVSTGTDITDSDLLHIKMLCEQIIDLSAYRVQLYDYLKNRMATLAPNVTALVGELVGARLISHAGTLVGLAKYPASTVQILGAEKALFRAMKMRKDTPKYGIIYHAQLIGQAGLKEKGRMARKLAAKVSLASRIDALSTETNDATMGIESRAHLETMLRKVQEGRSTRVVGKPTKHEPYTFKSESGYDGKSNVTVPTSRKRKDLTVEEPSSGDTTSERHSKKSKKDDSKDEEGRHGKTHKHKKVKEESE